jgi:hypothetical protein
LHTQLTLFPEALSLKRVYGGPWIATIGRAVLLSLLYFVTFLIIGLLAETVVLSL